MLNTCAFHRNPDPVSGKQYLATSGIWNLISSTSLILKYVTNITVSYFKLEKFKSMALCQTQTMQMHRKTNVLDPSDTLSEADTI
jgi:hypothetical protein